MSLDENPFFLCYPFDGTDLARAAKDILKLKAHLEGYFDVGTNEIVVHLMSLMFLFLFRQPTCVFSNSDRPSF